MSRNIENNSCPTIRVDPKAVFEPHLDPKKSPFQTQKAKENQDFGQKQEL